MHRIVHVLVAARADALRHQHARAHRKADEQRYDQIENGAGGPHGDHAQAARKPPHDHKIRGVEQQLQNAREHHGDRVKDDLFGKRAFAHIGGGFVHNILRSF